jgi:hypothetical protein
MVASAVAYEVTTTPSTGAYICKDARPLAFNAMTIDKGGTQTRTECVWRSGESIAVTKVETLEVAPLAAWYLAQTPPKLVGVEDRIGRGHRGVEGVEACSTVVAQRVQSAIENGEIGWRDLADFYARHRCQSYRFPSSYRALKNDGERQLPAVD